LLKNRIQQFISENIAKTIHSANCQQKYRQNLGLAVRKSGAGMGANNLSFCNPP
jgi:hypothetical protein